MKKNFKYLLVGIGTSMILPVVTHAATMSIDDEKINGNTATYSINYTGAEGDSNSIKFDVGINTNVKIKLTKDSAVSGQCSESGCYLDLPTTYIAGEKIKVADIVLTNTTSEDITSNLKINMAGEEKDSKNGITLTAGQTTTTKAKSNNANITNLGLSVGNLDKTFDPNTLEYTITGIKDTINSITINPTCENCEIKITCPDGGCTVSNTKRITLQTGANLINVNVTSEDGSSNKTYKLNVYRGDVTTSSAYLQSLTIKDALLSPTFNSMTNDYTAKVTKDLKTLDIKTTTEDPSAKVEIKGNKDLKEGENTITITVTSSDGENKQVYTIIVTKEKKEETKKVTTTAVKKKKNNTWLIILLSILGLGIIITTFLIIFKKKKNKKNKKDDKSDKNNDNGNKNDTNKNEDKNELDMLEESKYNVYGQEINEDDLLDDMEESDIEKENTDTLRILEETKRQMREEPKQDVDDALDDLMKTKKLELGDLDF